MCIILRKSGSVLLPSADSCSGSFGAVRKCCYSGSRMQQSVVAVIDARTPATQRRGRQHIDRPALSSNSPMRYQLVKFRVEDTACCGVESRWQAKLRRIAHASRNANPHHHHLLQGLLERLELLLLLLLTLLDTLLLRLRLRLTLLSLSFSLTTFSLSAARSSCRRQ